MSSCHNLMKLSNQHPCSGPIVHKDKQTTNTHASLFSNASVRSDYGVVLRRPRMSTFLAGASNRSELELSLKRTSKSFGVNTPS